MKQTTNYSFNKPELVDSPPDITVLNPNFDKIDTQLKSLTDKDAELNTAINQVKTDYLPKTGGNVTNGLTVKNKTVAVSVNGSTADANGNITIDVGGDVQSVNGVQPDENGNVVLDLGGDVQSVDGVEPDAEGNVALNASTRDEILEGAKRVTDVEVDAEVAVLENLQTSVARVESNMVISVNGKTPVDGNVPFTIGAVTKSTSGVDLNTITEAGVYYVNKGSTELNFPNGSNGFLIVYEENSFVRQVFYRAGTLNTNDMQIYTRQIYETADGMQIGNWIQDVYLIESWRSGANWYRKWSDGSIEQGGSKSSLSETSTITFHTAFSNTNYQFVWSAVGTADTSSRYYHNIQGRTTTTVTIKDHKFGTGCPSCVWYACGY